MDISIKKLINKNKTTFNIIVLELFTVVLGCLSLFIHHQNSWFMIFFLVSILQLIIHLIFLYANEKKFFTFPIFFMILSYIFNFGHIPLKAFGTEFGKNVLYPMWYIDFPTYQLSALFALLSQMMIFFGIYLFIRFAQKNILNSQKIYHQLPKISLKTIRILGYMCIAIGLIPTLYIDISKLILFIQGGYTNTFNLNIHDFIEVVANFFNFGIFALIIGYSKQRKVANIIFVSTIGYKVIMMSSGGRGEAIVFLLGLFIVWENLVMNLSVKQIIYLLIIGYFGLVLLNFIASMRNIPSFQIDKIMHILWVSFADNQIVTALSEFGSTFSTLCFTIKSNPSPTFGLNYIFPIILILPNIAGFNSGVVDQMIFTKHINTFNQPIGGSYIAELFYSFHWFGWIFAIVLGILIGYISFKISQSQKDKNYFTYLLFSYSMPLLFFWIRGYFGAIYRELIWHGSFAICFIFVLHFLQKKYRKDLQS